MAEQKKKIDKSKFKMIYRLLDLEVYGPVDGFIGAVRAMSDDLVDPIIGPNYNDGQDDTLRITGFSPKTSKEIARDKKKAEQARIKQQKEKWENEKIALKLMKNIAKKYGFKVEKD